MNIDQHTQTNAQPVQLEVKQANRQRWRRITLISSLLLGLVLLVAALHLIAPTIPGHAENLTARVGWYLTHGQWRADSRTLAAAWNFCLERETEMPTGANATNGSVAATPTETLPKS